MHSHTKLQAEIWLKQTKNIEYASCAHNFMHSIVDRACQWDMLKRQSHLTEAIIQSQKKFLVNLLKLKMLRVGREKYASRKIYDGEYVLSIIWWKTIYFREFFNDIEHFFKKLMTLLTMSDYIFVSFLFFEPKFMGFDKVNFSSS